MPVKQKPEFDVVKAAARALKDPQTATPAVIKRMAARILDDEKNAPKANATVPKPRSSRAKALYPNSRY